MVILFNEYFSVKNIFKIPHMGDWQTKKHSLISFKNLYYETKNHTPILCVIR